MCTLSCLGSGRVTPGGPGSSLATLSQFALEGQAGEKEEVPEIQWCIVVKGPPVPQQGD